MAQTVIITLTIAGADTGPFDLYSNIDGYVIPFENDVAKLALETGYTSVLVPDSATIIRVKSDNVLCSNFIDLAIFTTTTTTTAIPTTTTTSTAAPTTTTTTTAGIGDFEIDALYGMNFVDVNADNGTVPSFTFPINTGNNETLPMVTGFAINTNFSVDLSGTRVGGTNKTLTVSVNGVPQDCSVISSDGAQNHILIVPGAISTTDDITFTINISGTC